MESTVGGMEGGPYHFLSNGQEVRNFKEGDLSPHDETVAGQLLPSTFELF